VSGGGDADLDGTEDDADRGEDEYEGLDSW